MKMTRFATAAVLAAALNVVLAGCKKKPPVVNRAAGSGATTRAASGTRTAAIAAAAPAATAPRRRPSRICSISKTLEQLNAEKPLGRRLLRARFAPTSPTRDAPRCRRTRSGCSKWTTTKVTVEGHCDSRGTAEYNLGAR